MRKYKTMLKTVSMISLFIFTIILLAAASSATPSAPSNLSNSTLAVPTPTVGSTINSSGGTITNITINSTTLNSRWKGFVGNINGTFALQDSSSNALVTWTIETITGEIYASRNSSIPEWSNIKCANSSVIDIEDSYFGFTSTYPDSINNTFNNTIHEAFYIGTESISADSCRSVGLNVNSAKQTAEFQEVLVTDNINLIYVGLLENDTQGFDGNTYDFQMIIAENASQGAASNTAYYFYVELI